MGPLKSRRLRDTLEHYDERLDKYLLSDLAGTFTPTPVIKGRSGEPEPPGQVFMLLDVDCECYSLLGEVYPFGDLLAEIERVLRRTYDLIDGGSMLRSPKGGST